MPKLNGIATDRTAILKKILMMKMEKVLDVTAHKDHMERTT